MSKISKRAVTTGAVCASMILVGVLFWPDMRTESPGLGYAQTGATKTPTQGRSLAMQLSDAFESAANRVSPAVVPIYAEKNMERSDEMDDLFRRFFGERPPGSEGDERGRGQTLRSVGSGVIARADGYILTNNHVVADAQRLTLVLSQVQAIVDARDAEVGVVHSGGCRKRLRRRRLRVLRQAPGQRNVSVVASSEDQADLGNEDPLLPLGATRCNRLAAALERARGLRGRGGLRDQGPLQGRAGGGCPRPRGRLHAPERPVGA